MPSKIRKQSANTALLTVSVGYDEKGKQIVKRKSVTASSRREAEKAYNLFASEVQKGEVAFTGKLKLYEFAQRWFDEHCKKKLAPKIQRSYRNHLNNRILPVLGHIDINKLQPSHIISFINNLQNNRKRFDGRGGEVTNEAVRYSFRILSSMLNDAVHWQIIPNNPCEKVEPPSGDHSVVKIPTEENIDKITVALADEPLKYRTIVMLAIDSGLRLGELMGLKWSDIDFENFTLNVTKSNQALSGTGIFTKSPKDQSSVRKIAISLTSIELLKKHQQVQIAEKNLLAEKWIGEDWIFTQWNGRPIYPTTPSSWFRKFLKRNNLPHMSFHALRHLSATVLIAQGIPLKNVSSRLGHADIRTTANILERHCSQLTDKQRIKWTNF